MADSMNFGAIQMVELTLSLDTIIYASGDVLAGTQEVARAGETPGRPVVVDSLVLLDKDDQAGALDVVFLRTNVSIGTENAPVTVTDANADEIAGVVKIAALDYVDLANSQIVCKNNIGIIVDPADASTSIFVALISRDAKTYSASGITLKVGLLRP